MRHSATASHQGVSLPCARLRHRRGFTLVEMLVAISVAALLVAAVFDDRDLTDLSVFDVDDRECTAVTEVLGNGRVEASGMLGWDGNQHSQSFRGLRWYSPTLLLSSG